jgi:hypothetical protein
MKTHINTATNTLPKTRPQNPKNPNQREHPKKIQPDQSSIKFGKNQSNPTQIKGRFIDPAGMIRNSWCPTPTGKRKERKDFFPPGSRKKAKNHPKLTGTEIQILQKASRLA